MQGKVNDRLRPEAILLAQLLFGYGLACLCFLGGLPLGGWQFWVTLGASLGLAAFVSRRAFRRVLALEALMFVLTAFTFTYHHCDAAICHLPMSQFFEEGWNPVRDCSLETVLSYYRAHGITPAENPQLDFHALHVLVDPKFTQVLAAQMQAACRLFTAAAYPLWLTTFAVALLAFRTAREVLSAPRWAAVAFAALLCCNTELTVGSLQGQMDLVTYNAIAVSALSLVLWERTKAPAELLTFFAGLVIVLVSKFTGILCTVFLLAVAAWLGRRDRAMRRGFLLFAASLALFGILPYWTSSYWFGSPLYPAHTFRAGVALPDITNDFVGLNEEARQMGYFGRMVYAWVSPELALWGCRHWYGNPDFNPLWKWDWLTGGSPWYQCLYLWTGVALSFCSRRNAVTLVAWAVFLSFFLLPAKYIGYPRYVAQVHLAVVFAWFNFAAERPETLRRWLWLAAAALAAWLVRTACRDWLRQLLTEAVLQHNARLMRRANLEYSFSSADDATWTWAYAVRERLARDGVRVSVDGPGERLRTDWNMILVSRGLRRAWQGGFYWPCNVSRPLPLWK